MEATVHTKMNDLQNTEQEKSVLRWGGLAGMLGSVIFVVTFVFVGVFVGDESAAVDWVERFPEIRWARTVENSLFLAVLVLWVPHFLALYRVLRRESLAPAGCTAPGSARPTGATRRRRCRGNFAKLAQARSPGRPQARRTNAAAGLPGSPHRPSA